MQHYEKLTEIFHNYLFPLNFSVYSREIIIRFIILFILFYLYDFYIYLYYLETIFLQVI